MNLYTKRFKAGKAFIDWQKENQICYFPNQRNLTYFGTYSQDNCLLECKVEKISKRCGCAPWFIPRRKNSQNVAEDILNDLPVCDSEGSKCFEDKSKAYNEDLIDRSECDCKNDCEMVHTFSTLQVRAKLHSQISSNVVIDKLDENLDKNLHKYIFHSVERALFNKHSRARGPKKGIG